VVVVESFHFLRENEKRSESGFEQEEEEWENVNLRREENRILKSKMILMAFHYIGKVWSKIVKGDYEKSLHFFFFYRNRVYLFIYY
jgi:hypothetical protein